MPAIRKDLSRESDSFTPPPAFIDACRDAGIALDQGQLARFEAYLRLLLEANRSLNLTAVRDPETAWTRHLLDSLSLIPHLPTDARLIDLGSGGGLPGIPLAIARPDLQIALLEATGKKARFIDSAITELGLANAAVLHARAETAGHDPDARGQFDAATARALATLPAVIELALPFLNEGGRLLAMKGERVADELEAAEGACRILGGTMERVHETGAGTGACIVEIRKTAPTPEIYPRRPGVPAKKPLGGRS